MQLILALSWDAAMLRRSGKNRRIWVRLNPLSVESFPTACPIKVSYRRFGKWKPLGACYHLPSDPTLLNLMRSLRDGKRSLMGLARHAAIRDTVLVRLVEKWDALSAGAQKAVTLTDLCKVSNVTPARFIAAVARAGCEIRNMSVVLVLSTMDLPADVELALENELAFVTNCNAVSEQNLLLGSTSV
jgi:hypothetical protein